MCGQLRKRAEAEAVRERTRKGVATAVDRLKSFQERVHAAQEEVHLGGAWVGPGVARAPSSRRCLKLLTPLAFRWRIPIPIPPRPRRHTLPFGW